MWEKLKDKVNGLADKYKWLNSLRILVLSFKFVLSFTKKETIISILGWLSMFLLGIFKFIDWYWAFIISIPTLAVCLHIYDRFITKKSPLKIGFKGNYFEEQTLIRKFKEKIGAVTEMEGINKTYYCYIQNPTSKNIENVKVGLQYNKE